jgi:hypothetical protein
VFFVSYQPPTPRTKRVSVEGSASGVVVAAKTPTCAVCDTPRILFAHQMGWASKHPVGTSELPQDAYDPA